MALSCTSFEIKVENPIFIPPLHSKPLLGGPRLNISILFVTDKLEGRGYLKVKNFEVMYNRLDTIPACVRQTDRRTDRQTSCHGIVRAMHTRHAVKARDSRQISGRSLLVCHA